MVVDGQVDLLVVVGVQHRVKLRTGNLEREGVALPEEVEVAVPVGLADTLEAGLTSLQTGQQGPDLHPVAAFLRRLDRQEESGNLW